MNGDHTWQRLIRVSLISVLVCVALGAGAQLMLAQPRQPANKSRRAASEDVPSLLHEAALLLQAGKLDEAVPLLRPMLMRTTYSVRFSTNMARPRQLSASISRRCA